VALEAAEVGVARAAAVVEDGVEPVGEHVGGAVLQGRRLHEVLGVHAWVAHLLVEGVPVGLLRAIGHADHEDRQAGLAEEHVLDEVLIGLDVALRGHLAVAVPERVPVDEEVRVLRGLPVAQDVLELRGEHGGVVEDEVELEVDPQPREGREVGLGREQVAERVVDHGEAPVEVRVEHAGQDVGGLEDVLQCRGLEEGHEVRERPADRVGVRVDHGAGLRGASAHELEVRLVVEQLTGLRDDDARLVRLRVEERLLEAQHHGGERAVDGAVTRACPPVRERLLRRAVQQDRDVHALDVVVVPVRPLHDDHAGGGDVHVVVPQRVVLPAHPLQEQVRRPHLELGDDAVDLGEVDLGGAAEVAGECRAPRCLVGAQPRVLRHLRGIGVQPLRLEERQLRADRLVVGARGDEPLHPAGPEHAQAFGVVDTGDAPRVVVAGHDVRADTPVVQVVREQRADLGLADAGAAVDGDDGAAVVREQRLEQLPQAGEDRLGLVDVALGDLHLVTGHVPRGDGVEIRDDGKFHDCSSWSPPNLVSGDAPCRRVSGWKRSRPRRRRPTGVPDG